jgi:hypothetical protein
MLTLDLKKIVLHLDFGPLRMGSGDGEKELQLQPDGSSIAMNRGSTFKEVVEHLGPPSDHWDDENGIVTIIYGWYEFFFFDDELHYFQNDHLKFDCANHDEMIEFQNEHFTVDQWFLAVNRDFTLREIVALLEENDAKFKVSDEHYRIGELKIIALSNGVTIDFENVRSEFKYSKKGKIKGAKDVIIANENDFVLNGIRYDSYQRKPE